MGDFYQFPPVIGRSLWEEVCIEEDPYSKMLWKSFNAIITLTQQMHQIDNPVFNVLLQRVHAGSLTDADVTILNNKVAKVFPLHDPLKNTVIIQKNKSRHMINRLQVERFARHTGRDSIIFPAYHAYNRKNGRELIIYHDIIKIQDCEHGAIGPDLLYYSKEMPYIVLANVCTPLGIMNGAIAIAYGVVPYPDGILTVLRWNQ